MLITSSLHRHWLQDLTAAAASDAAPAGEEGAAEQQQQQPVPQSPGQDQQPLSTRRSQRLSPLGPVSMAGTQEGGGMAVAADAAGPHQQEQQQPQPAGEAPSMRTAEEEAAERAAAAAAAEEERRREDAVLAEGRRIREILSAQKASGLSVGQRGPAVVQEFAVQPQRGSKPVVALAQHTSARPLALLAVWPAAPTTPHPPRCLQVPPFPEPKRIKTHWDCLLEEMAVRGCRCPALPRAPCLRALSLQRAVLARAPAAPPPTYCARTTRPSLHSGWPRSSVRSASGSSSLLRSTPTRCRCGRGSRANLANVIFRTSLPAPPALWRSAGG